MRLVCKACAVFMCFVTFISWGGFVDGFAMADCSVTSVGLTPLNDLTNGQYQGFSGGLYPNQSNIRPEIHEQAGLEIARNIRPLNAQGNADAGGSIGLISVGMSNTNQEFGHLLPLVEDASNVRPQMVLVNAAQGGQSADKIVNNGTQYWAGVDHKLSDAGLTAQQVQVVWLKQADGRPSLEFPANAQQLQDELKILSQTMKDRFPNLAIIYFSSRIYGGYSRNELRNEPISYQTGFAVKWVIEAQINGDPELNYDPANGPVRAPWLSWGPYLWADGLNPRSDGLTWACDELREDDGHHPSDLGRDKVAAMLLDFFQTDATAQPWFLNNPIACLACSDDVTVAGVFDNNQNTFIDDAEVLNAVRRWASGRPLPETGEALSDQQVKHIVDLWIQAKPIDV